MKIITISNQKGGSGKTSSTVLLTLAIASTGMKVLIVDCDPQAGSTSFLLPHHPDIMGLFDMLVGEDVIPQTINRNGITFDLMPSDHRLDKIYATMSPYELERFKKLPYDYIIFDTPPTVQGITRAAAIIADKIIIPADISRATIKPTLYTLEALKEIKKKGKVLLVGKEPEKETKGFIAETARDFIKALGTNYGGTIQRNVAMQKAVSDETMKWSSAKIAKLLAPVLKAVNL